MNDCVEVYLEMEAEAERLEDEVSVLKGQIKTLADFLLVNFRDEAGQAGNILEGAVEMAVRLLTEEKKHRQWIVSLRDELRTGRRQVRTLTAEQRTRRQRIEKLKTGLAELIEATMRERQKGEPDG